MLLLRWHQKLLWLTGCQCVKPQQVQPDGYDLLLLDEFFSVPNRARQQLQQYHTSGTRFNSQLNRYHLAHMLMF